VLTLRSGYCLIHSTTRGVRLFHVPDQRAAFAAAQNIVERDGGELLILDAVGAILVGSDPLPAAASEAGPAQANKQSAFSGHQSAFTDR
jgi:hypothetical protein